MCVYSKLSGKFVIVLVGYLSIDNKCYLTKTMTKARGGGVLEFL